MGRGAWWITVHEVAKSWTSLSDLSTHTHTLTHACARTHKHTHTHTHTHDWHCYFR